MSRNHRRCEATFDPINTSTSTVYCTALIIRPNMIYCTVLYIQHWTRKGRANEN